ncbi:peptidoglycan-binding domain-containing protein, partial [Streptomyces sp. NPDC006393]|uniref:peptidoglycan-binding domain-containing protein n=1 Tax=Streptomyces sp. NPDC006393 TaxID=3156763 RepID=UPI0033FDFDD9
PKKKGRSKVALLGVAVVVVAGLAYGAGLLMNPPAAAQTLPSPSAPAASRTAAYTCGYYSGSALTVYGNTGSRVYEVQCLLVRLGYRLSLDGIFGSATRSAVTDFQSVWNSMTGAHLAVDGKVGSQTWAALRSATG